MSDAEVMTTSIVAAVFFARDMERARTFLKEQGYIPTMRERSRFDRCQYRIAELLLIVFNLLASFWKDLNEQSNYVLDSFPVATATIIESRGHNGTLEKIGEGIKLARNAIFMA